MRRAGWRGPSLLLLSRAPSAQSTPGASFAVDLVDCISCTCNGGKPVGCCRGAWRSHADAWLAEDTVPGHQPWVGAAMGTWCAAGGREAFLGPSREVTSCLSLDPAQHCFGFFFAVTPFLSLSPVYLRVCAHVKLPFPSPRKVE